MPKYIQVLAVLVLLTATGCKDGSTQSAAMKPVDAGTTPDIMVSNAVETRATLSSLAGQGVMRIVDTPNKFGLTVNANVVADESDRLRIRGDKLAGAIQAFDVVMLGDDIGFYVPTQRTLYHGKVTDLRYFAFRFDPDEVLRQMLRPDTSLLLKRWEVVAGNNRDRSDNIILQERAPANRPRLELAISRRTGMIASITQLDAYGQPVLIKSYGDYRGLSRGRKSDPNAPVFPYLMTLSWPRDKRMMELHFKSVDGDAVVLDEDFELATSDDTHYRPLVEANLDDDFANEQTVSAAPMRSSEGPM